MLIELLHASGTQFKISDAGGSSILAIPDTEPPTEYKCMEFNLTGNPMARYMIFRRTDFYGSTSNNIGVLQYIFHRYEDVNLSVVADQ
jgi:hypothetical protein